MRISIAPLAWTSIALCGATVAWGAQTADPVDFNREVRPLLRTVLSVLPRSQRSEPSGRVAVGRPGIGDR